MKSKKYLLLLIVLCISCIPNTYAPLIFVEGNVGSGKSTFLNVLHQVLPTISVVSEPVDEWQNIAGHNLLDAFYKDSCRWACTFQLYALMTRLRKQQASIVKDAVLQIMERSWFSDRFCFAKNCFLLGMLNEMEWEMYCGIWRWHAACAPKPVGIIYLQTSPDTCYKRMQQRARCEESIVSLEYLKMLHERHEEWLVKNQHPDELLTNIPVLILDATDNFKDDYEVQQRCAQKIIDFLKKEANIDFNN